MGDEPGTIERELTLRLVVNEGARLPVLASLRYDAADPYAVRVAFHTGGGESVEWVFARQLLTEGTIRAAGQGDVRVWPAEGIGEPVVCLALSSPSGRALFEVCRGELADFLTRTCDLVPSGSEGAYLDVDAELALLLWREV